jgi:5-methylphenazine-1-carboxylate 1-monooxygenase
MKVIIAGGGIGGLATALSLHQAGIECDVFESVDRIDALGVGINLLPHAVRELDALGLLDRLMAEGVAPTKLAYFTKRGEEIWHEPRGLDAGYRWPQISFHRGHLQRVLHAAVVERLGSHRVHTGHHLSRFDTAAHHAEAVFVGRDRVTEVARVRADVLIASDGIHSQARRQLLPDEGMPIWNGAKLWRGLAEGEKLLDGRTQIWAGHRNQKFVAYPIRDLPGGGQIVNFIAELRFENAVLAEREDWNQPGVMEEFLPEFESWAWPWLDVPGLIRRSGGTFLFPMVDRDPIDRWSHGRMTLLGDAAHPMYPVGSNGASQAILDARTIAGCLRSYPNDIEHALAIYDERRRPPTGRIVLANRGMGPELPMQLVEDRAPDGFSNLHDVITPEEILTATEGYRATAGFGVNELNERPSLADLDY